MFERTIMEFKCGNCGKEVTYFGKKGQYLYKKGTLYFCSDKCKRAYSEKREKERLK